MSNENSTGLNHFALYQQGITSFMQPLRTSFSRLDFDTSCHIWWTDTDAKILSFSFSPKKLLAILHDITSPNSSCLQLNENSHCALTSCVACQGKSYPFTCKRTFYSFLGHHVPASGWHQTCPFSCPQHRFLRLRLAAWLSMFTT